MVQAQKLVNIIRNADPEPTAGDVNVVVDNEYFKITTEPFRSFGTFTFITNKSGEKLGLTVVHIKPDGKKINWSKGLKKGQTLRMLQSDNYESIYINYIKIGVSNYIRLNETYSLQ
jgi:hypothetical protein